MTLQAPAGRKNYLSDVTRWNRAGLSRLQYVDGDAAVWLEELRIALLGLYLGNVDPEDRMPEKWRDLFMKQPADRKLNGTYAEFEDAVSWKDLLPAFPANVETGGKRNARLLEQYDRQSPDYAWEIMRAFARAAHILLGHQNAYANEGYLRTATQWENLRKLAAFVNYQPTPPASATTTVALEIEPEKDSIEIARGLAMKYAPPEGGAPLIFETLKPVQVHPHLHAVRSVDWNKNLDNLDFSNETSWITPEKAELAQGDLAVVSRNCMMGPATMILSVDRDTSNETANLRFEPAPLANWPKHAAKLLIEPENVQVGLPKTTGAELVIATAGASSYPVGSVVLVARHPTGSEPLMATVTQAEKGHLTLDAESELEGDVTIQPLTPFDAPTGTSIETPLDVETLYFKHTTGGSPLEQSKTDTRYEKEGDDTTPRIAYRHEKPAGTEGPGYALIRGASSTTGSVVTAVTWNHNSPDKSVRFEGKPPKTLSQGDWYVARPIGTNTLSSHKVTGIRIEADVHHIQFCPDPPLTHEKTEFFGPMTRELHPVDFDRDQRNAISGGECCLESVSGDALDLLKAGKDIIVVNDENEQHRAGLGTITEVEPRGAPYNDVRIAFDSDDTFAGWKAGWTRFHLNTVDISHGETKDPKVLGSGDAEIRRQDFRFKIADVSFIPSSASSTGVMPDMDVAVDDVKWEFRDFGDPTAEGQDAWSFVLNEDDTLQLHFRRRLPTGTNNLSVVRHRVGVGSRGTGIPGWSFDKPMKKNRFVSGVIQPFVTAGGADREPVADIRENAPSKLAANGRAVSLRDFGRLCRRHSSVWQAKARQVIRPGAVNEVDIVVVPAGGGGVTTTLKEDLIDFVKSRTLPNAHIHITPYQTVGVTLRVSIHFDAARYDKDDVKEAVENALLIEFHLKNRALEQALYSAEVLAAMERVEGVSAATITQFALRAGAPAPLRKAHLSGALTAIFPTEEQVVVLAGLADVTVDVEVSS